LTKCTINKFINLAVHNQVKENAIYFDLILNDKRVIYRIDE